MSKQWCGCQTGDSNPHQYCAWLFSRTLYQLSYPCTINPHPTIQSPFCLSLGTLTVALCKCLSLSHAANNPWSVSPKSASRQHPTASPHSVHEHFNLNETSVDIPWQAVRQHPGKHDERLGLRPQVVQELEKSRTCHVNGLPHECLQNPNIQKGGGEKYLL